MLSIIQLPRSSVDLGEVGDWNGWNGTDFYLEGVKIEEGIQNSFKVFVGNTYLANRIDIYFVGFRYNAKHWIFIPTFEFWS